MSDLKVAILGAGPAGLMSAWACATRGVTPDIFSQGGPSKIVGAQYLHHELPFLYLHAGVEPVGITYIKRGTPEGYSYKVYRDSKKKSSWDRWRQGVTLGWPISSIYTFLWDRFYNRLHSENITASLARDLLAEYDVVASTIPPRSYCEFQDEHEFTTAQTWIVEEEPSISPWTIIYDGSQDVAYHRLSHLEGRQFAEYGTYMYEADVVTKPQMTTCGCMPRILRLGRYGQWKRDVLTSDAYFQMERYLDALL